MIRAALYLTLTIAVAAGESVTLICHALCDRPAQAEAETCHHAQSATGVSLTHDADCSGTHLLATATLGTELNRRDTHDATLGAVSNESLMTFERPRASRAYSQSVGSPPRTVALRI